MPDALPTELHARVHVVGIEPTTFQRLPEHDDRTPREDANNACERAARRSAGQ